MLKNITQEKFSKIKKTDRGVAIYACNTSTHKAEAEGLQVQGQPGLHSETLKKKKDYILKRHTMYL
jgi:hypothetical protein